MSKTTPKIRTRAKAKVSKGDKYTHRHETRKLTDPAHVARIDNWGDQASDATRTLTRELTQSDL